MTVNARRVVITGLGIVSSLGIGNDVVVRALEEMKSGIQVLPERSDLGFRSALSGVIEGFEPRFMRFGRKIKKSMPEFVEWAVDATLEALDDSGLEMHALKSPDVGLIFGNDSVAKPSYDQASMTAQAKNTAVLHS